MHSRTFILLSMLITTLSFAEQRLPIKEGDMITISVSAIGLNRIAIENDRILSVKGISGQFQMDKDPKLGQIFIQPTILEQREPINLFITTEKGSTYGLSLMTSVATPQSIVLIPDNSGNDEKWEKSTEYETLLISLIKAMHRQKPLKKFSIETNNKKHQDIKGAKITHLQSYQGANISGESYEIYNDKDNTIILEEKYFYHIGVRAIAILNKELKPNQKTTIYIIKS